MDHHHRRSYSGAHVSLGSVRYAAGAVVTALLAEKIKTPEQRYLVLAGIGALVGAASTAWRDHVRAQQESEQRRDIDIRNRAAR
jgi:hypothetical protein